MIDEGTVLTDKKCPVCGEFLYEIYDWNPEIFGTENNTRSLVCRNKDCKGWFCPECDEHHPYGTTCSLYLLKQARGHYDVYDSCI